MRGRPGESLQPLNFERLKSDLIEKHGRKITDYDVMSAAMYPEVCENFLEFRNVYGPVDRLDTRIFLTGPKVTDEFEVRSPVV